MACSHELYLETYEGDAVWKCYHCCELFPINYKLYGHSDIRQLQIDKGISTQEAQRLLKKSRLRIRIQDALTIDDLKACILEML